MRKTLAQAAVGTAPASGAVTVGTADYGRVVLVAGAARFWGKVDGFAARIPRKYLEDLEAGDVFVFCGKGGHQLCVLVFTGDSFTATFHRAPTGRYPWPAAGDGDQVVTGREVELLITYPQGISMGAKGRPQWVPGGANTGENNSKTNAKTRVKTPDFQQFRAMISTIMNKENQVPTDQEKQVLLDRIACLEAQVNWLKRQLFGPKTETRKVAPAGGQPTLFNEAEALTDQPGGAPVEEDTVEIASHRRKKRVGKREEDLSGLETEKIIHELPEDQRVCPGCGGTLEECGQDVHRREVTVIPAQYKVTEHVQTVYACRACDKNGAETTPMAKDPVPAPVIAGSGIASPSLVASIINNKYNLALPLHRQEQELARNGVPISRQTMANWMTYVSEHWLVTLYMLLKSDMLAQDVLHCDETPVQVLKEPGKKASTKSYMWLYRTGRYSCHPIVLYEYQPDRGHRHPQKFLAGFAGYIHVDGYEAYHHLLADILPVGCWAHVRRHFFNLYKALPEESRAGSLAAKGLQYCDRLFELERQMADLPPEQRHQLRQEQMVPLMKEFFAWVTDQANTSPYALPRSATAQALTYALNQRKYLENVLLDGRLELSNNRGERSIKPFVIGRKNWLFANTPAGADASAIIYSIVETAKENGLNPYQYLKHVLETAPNIDMQDPDAVQALLPWNAPGHCRAPQKQASPQTHALAS
jgi:transposase